MEHIEYSRLKGMKGKHRFYLYDNYSGRLSKAKIKVTNRSDQVINIGTWQNRIPQKSMPISIYSLDTYTIISSDVILQLAEEIKRIQKEEKKE